MTGQEIVAQIVRIDMPDMEQIRENCINQYREQSASKPKLNSRHIIRIAVPAIIAASIIITTAFAYGEDITAVIMDLFIATPIPQAPADGYIDISNNGELMSFQHEFDGEQGALEFYVYTYDIEAADGKYTVREIAFRNAGLVFMRPKDSNGFYLRQGETVTLYANLDLTPEYADEEGEAIQIGYFLDGVLYETYCGILAGGGVMFEITAPRDGEYMVFIINACAEMQNYNELTVTLGG